MSIYLSNINFLLRKRSWARLAVAVCSATLLTARKIALDLLVENMGQSFSIRRADCNNFRP